MRQHNIVMPQLEGFKTKLSRLNAPTERISDPIPVLFQSGYLTLKDYNPFADEWTLDFPNHEVYRGFAESLYNYIMVDYVGSEDAVGNAFNRLRRNEIDMEQFFEVIRKWYAGIPYSVTSKNQNEQFYQAMLYAVLVACNADVHAEEQTATGRMDIALKMPDAIYILELKYDKSAEEATQQVLEKDYAVRFAAEGRPVFAVGLNVSADHRTIESYDIVPVGK